MKTVEDRRQLWRLLLRKGQAECFATLTRKAFRVCTLAPLSPPRKGVPLRLARSPRRRLAPASGNIIGMRAVASGGRFLASRPKKPHWGFFPRSFIATRRTAVRLWLRARSRGGVGVPPLPPARSVSLAFVRRSVCAQGARCFSPCAPLCGSLARSVACFGSLRSVGLSPALLSLRRSFALYTSRCLAPAVPPCLPLSRSRSASGGSRRRPLRGLRLGWARSSPPAAYKAAPIVAGWRVRVKPCFSPLPPPSPQGEGARRPCGQVSCSSMRLSSRMKSSQGVYPSLSMKTPAS